MLGDESNVLVVIVFIRLIFATELIVFKVYSELVIYIIKRGVVTS